MNFALISNFDATLFADDTSLMMVDKNLKNLEHKVQIELHSVKISYPEIFQKLTP